MKLDGKKGETKKVTFTEKKKKTFLKAEKCHVKKKSSNFQV